MDFEAKKANYEQRYKELDKLEKETMKAYYNYEINIKSQLDNYNKMVDTLDSDLELPKIEVDDVKELDVEYLKAIYQAVEERLEGISGELDGLLGVEKGVEAVPTGFGEEDGGLGGFDIG